MVCGVCKRTAVNRNKIKRGVICEQCLRSLPESVQASADQFTAAQIRSLIQIVHTPAEADYKTIWAYSGNRNLKFSKDAMWLGQRLIRIKDLRSIRLDFHAKGIAKDPNTVTGIITLVIETKSPHFLMEEPITKNDICISYRISGCEITYEYPYYLDHLIHTVQMCIASGADTFDEAKAKMEARKRYEEQCKAEEEKKRRAQEGQTHTKRNASSAHNTSHAQSPFDAAKKMYGVELPYTKQELKKIRNRLILEKKAHPDIGGSDELFKEIQSAYELLLKYAS